MGYHYPEGNLKSLTHQRRGTGLRTRIGDGHTQIPKHEWNSGFLKNEENKKELFSFLSEEIVKKDLGGKLLLSTKCEREFFLTDHVMCLLSNHATTLKQIQ